MCIVKLSHNRSSFRFYHLFADHQELRSSKNGGFSSRGWEVIHTSVHCILTVFYWISGLKHCQSLFVAQSNLDIFDLPIFPPITSVFRKWTRTSKNGCTDVRIHPQFFLIQKLPTAFTLWTQTSISKKKICKMKDFHYFKMDIGWACCEGPNRIPCKHGYLSFYY